MHTRTHALLEELKTVAIKVKSNQIQDVAGNAEEDPQGRGRRTLLIEAGAGGGGGRWVGEGRGGGGEGRRWGTGGPVC